MKACDKTKEEFHAPDEEVSGEVYIGGSETKAIQLLAQLAWERQTKNPQIRYHLYSGNGEDVTERLDKELLNFGVLIEPVDISMYDFVHLHAKDVWGVLMRWDSVLAPKETITAAGNL